VPADTAIELRGPGGQSLRLHPSRPRLLLIGEAAGIGPTLFIAERVRELAASQAAGFPSQVGPTTSQVQAAPPHAEPPTSQTQASPSHAGPPTSQPQVAPPHAGPPSSQALSQPAPWRPLVLLGSSGLPFPFRPRPSVIVVPGIPTGIIACMPLLEEWGVASRLASTLDLPGCFEGSAVALANAWLGSLTASELAEVEVFPNGPASMVRAALELAGQHGVECQEPSVTG
jgi:hypothetical protein